MGHFSTDKRSILTHIYAKWLMLDPLWVTLTEDI